MCDAIAYRSSILHFLHAPHQQEDHKCYQYFADGLLLVQAGKVVQIGDYSQLSKELANNVKIIDYSNYLLMPGFIDTHIHYPQTSVVASYGERLLDWLNDYVFPEERKFSDPQYAAKIANFFLQELLRNGTTTSVTYATVHPSSVEAIFNAAKKLNMCMLSGKVLMDRNAPKFLEDTALSAYEDSKRLIDKWHNQGRSKYVITPRFAPTSTEAQLEAISTLLQENHDVYLQTHLSENCKEVAWVKEIYPWSKDYTDVYDKFNFLGERSLFGHAIHLSDREFQRLSETKSVITWCPTSNFFLGSGMFNLGKARTFNNRVAIATDVGGGTSFSMLKTLGEAYKVSVMQGIKNFSSLESFYRITLGNAEAISLDNEIGNFLSGKYADFVVIDLNSSAILQHKVQCAKNIEDILFDLSILGDDRVVHATYVAGEKFVIV